MIALELHEGDQGRVLPMPRGERTTISSWFAHQALSADNRTKYPAFADLAGRLIIKEVQQ